MLATELELPSLDYTDTALRGDVYRDAMAKLDAHDGWLASGPFGYIVTEREAGEFFLRTKQAIFPGLTIAEIFQISDGPLYEEIVNNIISVNGDDHRRLRNLVNPALSPRAVQRYRPAMQRFLEELLDEVGRRRALRVHRGVRQALPVARDRRGDGRAAERRPAAALLVEHDPASVRRRQPDHRPRADRAGRGRVLRLRGRADPQPPRGPRRGSDLGADRGRGGRRQAFGQRAAQPDPEHPGRRCRHQPEPARARGQAVGPAPRSVAGAARRPGRAGAGGGRRGRPLRADHAVHRADPDLGARVPRRHVPGRVGRAGVRLARQPRRHRRSPTSSTSPRHAPARAC